MNVFCSCPNFGLCTTDWPPIQRYFPKALHISLPQNRMEASEQHSKHKEITNNFNNMLASLVADLLRSTNSVLKAHPILYWFLSQNTRQTEIDIKHALQFFVTN